MIEAALAAVRSTPHVFLDLDGTLVGTSGDVLDSVWRAVEALEGWVGLSVCTGRPRAGVAQRIAARLDPDGLHIFENGGLVGPAHGEPVRVSELPVRDCDAMIEAASRIDAVLELYTPSGVFVSRFDDDCRAHALALDIDVAQANLAQVRRSHRVVRAHWIMREPALAAVLAIELHDSAIGVASSPVMPGLIFGSVTRRDTSKGTAAALVAELMGFELADAAAVGDAVGDLPLLKAVGHPFVVANAPAELRERYEVLGDVDGDGVLELLGAIGPALEGGPESRPA